MNYGKLHLFNLLERSCMLSLINTFVWYGLCLFLVGLISYTILGREWKEGTSDWSTYACLIPSCVALVAFIVTPFFIEIGVTRWPEFDTADVRHLALFWCTNELPPEQLIFALGVIGMAVAVGVIFTATIARIGSLRSRECGD